MVRREKTRPAAVPPPSGDPPPAANAAAGEEPGRYRAKASFVVAHRLVILGDEVTLAPAAAEALLALDLIEPSTA